MKANMLNVHLKYDKQFLILPFYMTHLFTLQKYVDFWLNEIATSWAEKQDVHLNSSSSFMSETHILLQFSLQ